MHLPQRFGTLALALVLSASPLATGRAADPSDPLAKTAPAVVVPKALANTTEPFLTIEKLDKDYPLPQDPNTLQKVRAARRAYQRQITLGHFEMKGQTKAKWADQVRAAMEAYAWAYSRSAARREGVYYQAFLKALREVDAACDDPLIVYWRLRHWLVREGPRRGGPAEARGRSRDLGRVRHVSDVGHARGPQYEGVHAGV